LQDFVNSTGKFNSIVVKMLKPVLCFSHDGVPLKLKKKNLPALKLNITDFFSPVSTPVKSRWTILLSHRLSPLSPGFKSCSTVTCIQ
jgi:hypothetical protein